MDVRADFPDFLEKKTAAKTEELSTALKDKASESLWPIELALKLRVVYEDGDFYVRYPESLTNEVHDLEYGSPDSPPQPVIRPFTDTVLAEAGEWLSEQTLDFMDEAEIFG